MIYGQAVRVLEGGTDGSLVLVVGDRLGRTSWTIRLTDPEEADLKAAEEARACADEDWRRAHEAGGGA